MSIFCRAPTLPLISFWLLCLHDSSKSDTGLLFVPQQLSFQGCHLALATNSSMIHTFTTVSSEINSHACSIDPVPDSMLKRQLGFMGSLYSDILLMIFSYLDQRDCLTCMEVCQAWQDIVPQYSQSVWESISFSSRELSMDTQYLEQFLGDNVRSVVFNGNDGSDKLYHMMQKLIDWNCNKIDLLGKKAVSSKRRDRLICGFRIPRICYCGSRHLSSLVGAAVT